MSWSSWREHPAAREEYLDAVAWHDDQDSEVVVVAYAHERRRPGYWRDRLGDA